MIQFACPSCRNQITASEQHAGMQVACPHCNTAMIVPQAAPRPSSVPSPQYFPGSQGSPPDFLDADILGKLAWWVKLAGGFSIFVGVIYCLSCVGIPLGVIAIMMGVFLNGASIQLRSYLVAPDGIAINEALRKLKNFFQTLGVIIIIQIIAIAILLIVFGSGIVAGIMDKVK